MLLQIDGTLIVLAISFIIFTFIMQKILYAPMTEIRKERASYIDSNNSLTTAALNESEELKLEREEKLTQARIQASHSVTKKTSEASDIRAEKLQAAHSKTQETINNQKALLQQEKEQAKKEIDGNVIELAQMISAKILKKEVPMSGVSHEIIDRAINS